MSDKNTCIWHQDGNESEVYDTACKQTFCTLDETPKKSGFNYCCYCGKKLEQKLYEDEN